MYSAGQNLKDFLILLAENSFERMTSLINYTDKFCCRHGNFQNTEPVTEGFLKSFTEFKGKRLCQSLFLNKVASLRPAASFKRDSDTSAFL